MSTVDQVVEALLYEGYLLWPYRRSAPKNQQRWTLGGVYPRAFSEAMAGADPWHMRTQCLVVGEHPRVSVRVRFLQVVERRVAERQAAGTLAFVDEPHAGGERYLSWDEAREREVLVPDLALAELSAPRAVPLLVAAGEEHELIPGGALGRRWRALEGTVAVHAEALRPAVYRLTVSISNTAPWTGQSRDETLRQTFVSTHTIVCADVGEFVALLDPPADLKALAETCDNHKTWPVLAGEAGQRRLLLSSPIILYDYPRVAPESPGDLFDAAEIDQLLALNILTLTDEEKAEMRATDPRARRILERTEALTAQDFLQLHGTVRDIRMPRQPTDAFEALERPVPSSIRIGDVALGRGSRVRLHPRPRGDLLDLALNGKTAIVERIEQDYDERLLVAVTLEDDPGRDLGAARMIGHRFFFAPDELEPLS